MTTADRAELEGVSAERAPQIVAGALVAEASMRALSLESVDICPGRCARASSCAAWTMRRRDPPWWDPETRRDEFIRRQHPAYLGG